MNNQKWNSVLIEWVNCLKLCKAIHSPDELRNGEFFSNLQKVITKSRTAQTDSLTFIFDLLGKHYPNYLFENKTEIHLNDLPEFDLKAMISLLMHYTCIYDRKDVLTSPLCHSLSQPTQLLIRNFFEKITKDVTKASMNNIIKICIEDASDRSTKHQWLSGEGSQRNSPLQDLLKTPVSKFGRLKEKDRIITKLKSELETERYDKAELQQELHVQAEKNKKIELQLLQKSTEIARLCGEVAALENRSLPHYQDMDSRELQRRLRSEIQSLELYIKQIEDEQDVIRKERDSAKEQLRKLESQSNIWEEKFFETEHNFETLKERSKKQETELLQLQEHCTEITALLEEYRSKSSNDSSLYDTFVAVSEGKCLTETPSCEDLACSVVEVQLRDVQKQNEELKLKIAQSEEVKTLLKDTKEELTRSKGCNEELTLKVTFLQSSNKHLEKRLSQTSDDLLIEKNRSQTLENELDDIKTISEKLQFELADVILNNQNLNSQIVALKVEQESLLNHLADGENTRRILETHLLESQRYSEHLKFINDELNQKFVHLDEEYREKTIQFEEEKSELCLKLQESAKSLVEVKTTNLELKSEINNLQNQLTDITKCLETERKLTKQLGDEHVELERQLSEVRKSSEQLTIVCGELQIEKQKFAELLDANKISLEISQQEKSDLSLQLTNSEESLVILTKTNDELLLKNRELEKQLLTTADGLAASKEIVEELLQNRNSLEIQLSHLKGASEHLEEELEKMRLEDRKVREELESVEQQLRSSKDACNSFEERNNELDLCVGNLKRRLVGLQEDLKLTKEDLQSSVDACSVLGARFREEEKVTLSLRENIQSVEVQRNKYIEELAENEERLEIMKQEKTVVESQLEASKVKCHDLEKSYKEEITKLCQKLQDAIEELQRSKKESVELQNRNEELDSKLQQALNSSELMQIYQKEIEEVAEHLKCEIEEIQAQYTRNVAESVTLKSEKAIIEKQLEELTTTKNNLEAALMKITEEMEELQLDKVKLHEDLMNVRKENQILITNLEETQRILELCKNDLEETRTEKTRLETLSEDLKCENERIQVEKTHHLTECDRLRSDKAAVEKQLVELTTIKNNLEGALETVTEEVDRLLEENGAKIQKFEVRIEELTATVTNLEKRHCEDQKTIDDRNQAQAMLEQQLEDFHALTEELQRDKLTLEEDIANSKNEKLILIANSEDFQLKLVGMVEQLADLEGTKNKLEGEKGELSAKLTEMKEQLNATEIKNEEVNENLEKVERHKRELEEEKIVMLTKIQTLEAQSEDLISQVTNLRKQHDEDQEIIDHRNQAQEMLEQQLENFRALTEELRRDKLQLEEDIGNMKNEKQILIANSEDFQLKLRHMEEKLSDLEETKSELEGEKTELAAKLAGIREQLNEMELKNQEVTSNLEKVANHEMKLEEEKIEMLTKIQKLEAEKEELTSTVSNLQKQHQVTIHDRNHVQEMLEQKLEQLQVSTEELQFDKLKLNENLMNVNNENQMLTAKLEDFQAKLRRVDEEELEVKSKLENEKAELLDKLTEIQKQLNDVEIKNQEASQNLETVERHERELEEEKMEMLTKIQTLEARTEDLTTTVTNLEKQHREDQETIKEQEMMEQQLSALTEKLHLDKLKLDEDLINLKNENEVLIATKTKLESEKVELSTKLSEIREQLKDVEITKQVVLAQTVEYEKQKVFYDAVQKQNEVLATKLTQSQEKEKINNEFIKNLQEQVEEIVSENGKLEVAVAEMEDVKTQNADLTVQNDDLQKQLSEIVEEKQKLDAKITEYSRKIDDLQLQNDNLQSQLCVLETDYKQLKNNKEIIDRQLNEVSVVSETLAAEAEDIRVQYQTSKIELNETREALARLVKEKDDVEITLKEANDELVKKLELISEKIEEAQRAESDNKMLISTIQEFEKRLTDAETRNEESVNFKSEVENVTKRAEKSERDLKDAMQELQILRKKLEQLANENSILNKKVDVEEIISSENKERAKCLEETIQDYEITISGLKSVVDTNLELLESLKAEVNDRKCKEIQATQLIADLCENSNFECVQCDDLKSSICENFSRILKAQREEVQRRQDLETEIRELKHNFVTAQGLNSSVQGMIEKLQNLVTENGEIGSVETLKSCFDHIHTKVTNLLQAKQELSEDLRKTENEKSELRKQLETLKSEKEEIAKAKTDAEHKMETLRKEFENKLKPVKVEKENILGVSTKTNKPREEELKKENMMLKRKVVLAENAKNNLEKVLKELREEKKKASVPPSSLDDDVLYKKLLQEYIQVKEENERALKERDAKIEELKIQVKTEDDKKVVHDLQNIREAYGNLMSVNAKQELEMSTLRKIIDERNSDMVSMAHIKEAYERLLEDNNKVLTEIDTVKYKRMRDKEEFVRLLKKDREEAANRETRRIQQVRGEYEGKLEKMKEKMLRLYREEVNKKVKSVKDGHNETTQMMRTVANLKAELFEADQKIQLLEMEKEILKANRRLDEARTLPMPSISSITSLTSNHERSTLPRSSTTRDLVSQAATFDRLPDTISTHNLQMEDEEDLFNDKYLTDLKEGRCALATGRESSCRFSELAWRNSMVPPHLKSSYPAEMQFISPGRFKDDDIKMGNIEFEDSLCKLLPGEKPRKKDFGTTSYKRPGPPTPSKNGGRLSLQGNEIHPMREHCEAKTPKKSTPSRIRALFTGRNSSTRDGSESQTNGTPSRGRRLNIFRRPR